MKRGQSLIVHKTWEGGTRKVALLQGNVVPSRNEGTIDGWGTEHRESEKQRTKSRSTFAMPFSSKPVLIEKDDLLKNIESTDQQPNQLWLLLLLLFDVQELLNYVPTYLSTYLSTHRLTCLTELLTHILPDSLTYKHTELSLDLPSDWLTYKLPYLLILTDWVAYLPCWLTSWLSERLTYVTSSLTR